MANLDPKLFYTVGAIGLIAAGVLGFNLSSRPDRTPAVNLTRSTSDAGDTRCQPNSKFAQANAVWKVAAPGRIEPRGGEHRVWAATLGRIAEIEVAVGANVVEGQLLVRLDDEEARANLAAAEVDAASAKHARDQAGSNLGRDRQEVRDADDQVYQAEAELLSRRLALDSARGRSAKSNANVAEAQRLYDAARRRLDTTLVNLATALGKKLPEPAQLEAAVNKARAMVALARANFEKTRVRAKTSGKVLEIDGKPGEIASPSLESPPLMMIGDIERLRVVAEVDEAEIRHVKDGGSAFVCVTSEPSREFTGKVVRIAQTLGSLRLSRGPLRPTDVEVLKVWVELDTAGALKPGMRAEVFFQ